MLVTARRLFDGSRSPLIENAAVLIRDDRVHWAGSAAAAPAPPDEPHIDLGDATILPGLIDMHNHLRISHADGDLPGQMRDSEAAYVLHGLRNLETNLRAGVTTMKLNGDQYGTRGAPSGERVGPHPSRSAGGPDGRGGQPPGLPRLPGASRLDNAGRTAPAIHDPEPRRSLEHLPRPDGSDIRRRRIPRWIWAVKPSSVHESPPTTCSDDSFDLTGLRTLRDSPAASAGLRQHSVAWPEGRF